MELATRDLYWLAKIPALANQRISVMQLTGSLGRFAHLCGAGASAGNLVRVVATEQAAIGAFDHTRFAGGRDPQNSHRVLIRARTIGQRLALLHVIGSQRLSCCGVQPSHLPHRSIKSRSALSTLPSAQAMRQQARSKPSAAWGWALSTLR